MSNLEAYFGEAVPDQQMLSEKHCALFGNHPCTGAILSNRDLDGAVVFDGKTWRELDLAAMQNAYNQ